MSGGGRPPLPTTKTSVVAACGWPPLPAAETSSSLLCDVRPPIPIARPLAPPAMWHLLENAQNQFEMANRLFQDLNLSAETQTQKRMPSSSVASTGGSSVGGAAWASETQNSAQRDDKPSRSSVTRSSVTRSHAGRPQHSDSEQVSPLERQVAHLVKSGFDVNARHGCLLPLHVAAMGADANAISILLKYGAKVHYYDGYGRTAAHYAAEADVACLRLLLDAGANTEARDANAAMPLHYASGDQHACASLLLSAGAHPGAADALGDTPVHIACRQGNTRTLRMLLDRNPDLNLQNHKGKTPLQICRLALIRQRHHLQFANCGKNQERILCWRLVYRGTPSAITCNSRCGSRNSSRRGSFAGSQFQPSPHYVSGGLYGAASFPLSSSTLVSHMKSSPSNRPTRKLQDICRFSIRASLGFGIFLPDVVKKLPLPDRLQDFILLLS